MPIPTRMIVAVWCLMLVAACAKDSTQVEDEDSDTTPPAVVMDLMALNPTSTTVDLQWTAPADHRDDGGGGMVDSYDIRTSHELITAQTFAAATPVAGAPEPLPAGQIHHQVVTGLTPGTTHHFALKSRDADGNWSAISDCPHAECPAIEVVTFADQSLEQAIRDHVHKPSGDLLSCDVDTILRFTAIQAEIADLTGMQHCRSLVSAQLANNVITDLSPLMNLPSLGGLYVEGNDISDLEPLRNMAELRQLHLAWNPVTNLQPVIFLQRLEQLTLSGSEVADYSPLGALGQLHDLYLGGMNITEIDFAVQLIRLRNVNLEINHIYSLEPLRYLIMLEVLNLAQNQVVDLSPLQGLTNLRDLQLSSNLITDLQALVDNTGLGAGDVVRIADNPLAPQALTVQIPALEARGVQVIR